MRRGRRCARGTGGALLLAAALVSLALSAAPRAAAQSQGAALEKLREALGPTWVQIDPNKDACQYPGDVTPGVICEGSSVVEINLPNEGLTGAIPSDASLWRDLPALRKLDLSSNPGVAGEVPAGLADAPKLASMCVCVRVCLCVCV
ncbi:MAG: hypothetical protein J3K34DRAFT_436825 [Monoraphidium minutum]|nr:MAG: hypothetical protein J3K34DRAFT_436825 [Monoraphidium minutum]